MNEIQEYCLHVTESAARKDSIQYFIHNTETLYDISYYSNMIDIHVEDECSVSVYTFQLNAVLELLDRLLVASDPAGDAVVPDQPGEVTQPVTSKFNINSVSLTLNSLSFTYSMPGSFVPSYQRPDSSVPYAGEDKERAKSAQPAQPSQYAIPLRSAAEVTRSKSLLKSCVEFRMHGVEVVCNTYDNQFYTADLMCAVRQVRLPSLRHA